MNFDPQKLNQELETRSAEVICNELKALYDPEPLEDIVFKMQGLTGNDMAVISGTRDTGKFIEMLSEALTKNNGHQGADAIRSMLGIFDDSLHPQLKYRVELVVRGSADPVIDYPLAAKMAKDFYIVLYRLSEKVLELTGLGSQLKKKSSIESITIPSS